VVVAKTIAVALLLHAVFTVTLPYVILRSTAEYSWASFDLGPARWSGVVLMSVGAYLYVWSLAHLLGRETSAIPGAEATNLQTDGWYGRLRHPLLLGVVLILLGEPLWFGSFPLLAYALLYWIWLHAFVALKEEPSLHARFGKAYADYCARVPRWLPRVCSDS
jgi:protein-S-isoprenylcysteine O-methyltransferase Ste14